MESNFVYRFDYKYKNLPYYIYISFKNLPVRSTILRISKKLKAYHVEFCQSKEIISIQNHDIPIVEYKDFRCLASGNAPRKVMNHYPDLFSELPPY